MFLDHGSLHFEDPNMDLSRNRGGISRGDRADTGDLEARPTEGVGPEGSGVPGGDGGATGHPTANPDALPGGPAYSSTGIAEISGDTDLEDLTIHGASDPDLGLTDIGDVPPDDWAADTGPTRSEDASPHGVDRELVDEDRTPSGRRVDLSGDPKRKRSK